MPTVVTKTVGPSGRDYTSISAAMAGELAIRADLVARDEVLVIEPDSYEEATQFNVGDGFTCDATRYVHLRVPEANRFTGSDPTTGFHYRPSLNYKTIVVKNYCRIEGVGVLVDRTSWPPNVELGSYAKAKQCLIKTTASNGTAGFRTTRFAVDPVFENCCAIETRASVASSGPCFYVFDTGNVKLINCTAISEDASGGSCFYSKRYLTETTAINCVAFGSATNFVSATAGEWSAATSNNASEDATAPGANSVTLSADPFVASGSGDYSIANDSVLAKAGTNPLSPLSNPDDWKDITGKTRAYWDIGAFAAPASLAENTHLATFTTRPTDTGASGGPNVAGTETNYPGYIDLSEAPQALWDAVTSGGGDIRVFENQAGGLVELPAEVVSCDPTYQSFDGSNDYMLATGVSVTDADDFVVRMEARSTNTDIENFIFCFTSATAIIGVVSGGSGNGDKLRIQVRNDAGTDVFNVNDATESSASFFDGDWHEIVFTKSGDVFSVDVDGTEVINLENTNPGSITTNQLVIGGLYRTSLILACPVDIARLEVTGVFASTYDARNISGTTWTDSVGSNDGTLNGTPAAPVAASGELHYLLPSISASTPQEIRLYADGVSSRYDHADPFGRNAVWGDYEAVYHMADDPSAGTMTDSAGNWDLTSRTTMAAGDSVAGQMGSAVQFNGSNEGFSTTSPSAGFLSTPVSFQVVAATNNVGADVAAFGFYEAASTGGGRGWIGTNGSQFRVLLNNDLKTGTPVNGDAFWLAGGTNNDTGPQSRFANLNGSDWVRDGVFADLNTKYAAGDAIAIAFMADATPAGYWNGWVDEARISNRYLSANWIATEYNNQSDPSSFYTATDPNAGGSESISPDSLYQSVSIEGVTLTQAHVLAAANLAQLQAIGAATLAQANSIAPHGVDQTAGIESATLTQAHIIAPAGLSQYQQIGTASLVSAGVLSVFGLAQTQTLDEAILTVAGALDVDGVSQSQVLEALTLVQNNILAPAGLAQEAALEATTINAAALGITPAGIEQVMAIDPTGLTQYHVLAVSDLAQDQILEAARFGGLVIGELQGRIYVFAALDGDVYAIPALTGTIH
jgi:hypothetical protein